MKQQLTVRVVTSSWFTKLPAGMVRIGISRAVPRGQPAGYRRLRQLEPGLWFNSVTPAEYLRRYGEQRGRLSPHSIIATIDEMADGHDSAALLCFESPQDPSASTHLPPHLRCHRLASCPICRDASAELNSSVIGTAA